MALQGTFTKYQMVESGTLSFELTYPDDLPESHRLYDKRGTTETITAPNMVKQGTEYVDKYITVYNVTLNSGYGVGTDENSQPISGTDHKYYYTNIMCRVYSSSLSRSLWPNEYYEDLDIDQITNTTGSQDLINFAYTKIKEQEGFENLIDI